MGHRQKGKSKKRQKSWHRGAAESQRWLNFSAGLPFTAEGGDPTEATPLPLRRKGGTNRGDVA